MAAQPNAEDVAEDVAAATDPAYQWYFLPRVVFCGGNQVELLRGGRELFPAMHAAIAAARRSIWIATYIFHDDETALALAEALCGAAARGVQVRVVVDGFGSAAALPVLQPRLASAGVALTVFRPLRGRWTWPQPGELRRLHQKLCVVDGEVGFCGGVNLIDDRHDLHHGWSDQPRLDYAVRVSGPVVRPIEQTASAMWHRAEFGRDWRDEIADVAQSGQPMKQVRALLRSLRMPDTRHLALPSEFAAQPLQAAFVVRDNVRQRRTIERGYVDAIHAARRRVDIVSAYFYPGQKFRRALRLAARRGVRVRLLMQGRWDYQAAQLAARALYAELLGRGVEIHEYTPAFLHAKVALVDDDWATIGSSNIDPLSLLLNLEANVVVRDPGFSAALSRELDAAFAASHRVTQAEVGGRFSRLRRAFVAWCARAYLRIAGATGRY